MQSVERLYSVLHDFNHTTVVSQSHGLYVQRVSLAAAMQLRSAVRADVRIRSNTPCPLPALVQYSTLALPLGADILYRYYVDIVYLF